MKQSSNNLAFTLIELLIVIAVIGVLSVGVVTALNITSQIDKANLSKAKTFAASVENDLSINQVGKWSFDEGSGTTTSDSSGYEISGSVNNPSGMWKSPNDSNCKQLGFGGCMFFGGTANDFIDLGNPNNLTFNQASITITAWIKPTSVSGRRAIITRGISGSNGWSLNQNSKNLEFGYHGSWTSTTTNNPLSVNNWYFIAVSGGYCSPCSGTIPPPYFEETLFYINGDKQPAGNNGQWAYTTSVSAPVFIGKDNSSSGFINFFSGYMDEVAVYKKRLSLSQVQSLYAQGIIRHLIEESSLR